MTAIPASYHDLLHGTHTAVFTTLSGDGSPNSSPVWYIFDGEVVQVSVRAGRAKHRNVARDPRFAFTVIDPANPMRYIELRGEAEATEDPDAETRDRVSDKHGINGADFDPPGSSRITITLRPTRIIEH